ncbi:MAG: GIY-YIG nuclease family protein [Vitreimonas sp.]
MRILPQTLWSGARARTPGAKTFIYFILALSVSLVKIGIARDPTVRLSHMQTGCPIDLELIGAIETENGERDEEQVRVRFLHLQQRGEWFRYDDELKAFVAEFAAATRKKTSPLWRNVPKGKLSKKAAAIREREAEAALDAYERNE